MAKSFTGFTQDELVTVASRILKAALDLQETSLMWFERSQEECDGSTTSEMFWTMCREANERSKGLLDAYQILTDSEVVGTRYAIQEEIDKILQTF